MINKAVLLGNLGKDPEIHRLESGVVKASFSLATTDSYKDKNGERVKTTEWHNVIFWRGLAEVAEKYLKKGARIYVEGKITTREYEDKDGVKRKVTEIIGSEMKMLDKPAGDRDLEDEKTSSTPRNPYSNAKPSSPSGDQPEDDLPF